MSEIFKSPIMRLSADRAIALYDAPIQKLPTEILLEACKHLLYDSEDSRACIAVSKVCKYWRVTLIECPSLWAFVVVICKDIKSWNRSTLFMGRLQKYPYQLKLFFDRPSSTERLISFLQTISMTTIASLSVQIQTIECASALEAFIAQHHLPLLHTFNFKFAKRHARGNESEDVAVPDLTKFPALRSLSLSFNPRVEDFSHIHVNWLQLKYLNINNSSHCSSYLDVLEKCKSIERLRITPGGDRYVDIDARTCPKITLPHLKEYILDAPDSDLPSEVMLTVFPPNVEKFECYLGYFNDWEATYFDMLDYFAANLRTFYLSGDLFWPFTFFADLRQMVNLTHLRLVGPFDEDAEDWDDEGVRQRRYKEAFDALVVTGDNAPLPNLQVLELLKYPTMSRGEYEAIVRMMESRSPRKGGALKKVVITPEDSLKPVVDVAEGLKDQGMVLEAKFVHGFHY